jgi:hypothetical protein
MTRERPRVIQAPTSQRTLKIHFGYFLLADVGSSSLSLEEPLTIEIGSDFHPRLYTLQTERQNSQSQEEIAQTLAKGFAALKMIVATMSKRVREPYLYKPEERARWNRFSKFVRFEKWA